jgi:hypothetical protein
MIVPGGGLANDGSRWIPCKPNFLLPVRVRACVRRPNIATAPLI